MITSLTTLQFLQPNLVKSSYGWSPVWPHCKFYSEIWLNLLMDDHQFWPHCKFYTEIWLNLSYGWSPVWLHCKFYSEIWLNLLMDDHQFDYTASFTAKFGKIFLWMITSLASFQNCPQKTRLGTKTFFSALSVVKQNNIQSSSSDSLSLSLCICEDRGICYFPDEMMMIAVSRSQEHWAAHIYDRVKHS
jgi:hypothetical protein